jgi:biotin carboxyl carrier protein
LILDGDHAREQIAQWISTTDICLVEIDGPDVQLRLTRRVAATSGQHTTSQASPVTAIIEATGPGRFLSSHPLRPKQRLVNGHAIKRGDIVGYLQIGAILTAVVAPAAGLLNRWIVADGDLVGHGQPLAEILHGPED